MQQPQYEGGYGQAPYGQGQYQQPYAQAQAVPQGTATGTQDFAQPLANLSDVNPAQHDALVRTYAHMTGGLVVTALVAYVTYATGILYSLVRAGTYQGLALGLAIAEIIMVIAVSRNVMKLNTGTATTLYYVYAVLNGLTFSTIFAAYDAPTIAMSFLVCAVFFLALTMMAVTTKKNFLGAGPILLTALIVLVIVEIIALFVASDLLFAILSAVSIIIFTGYTIYDTQKMNVVYAQVGDNPEAIKALSINFALELYLDFINLFVNLLQLFGVRPQQLTAADRGKRSEGPAHDAGRGLLFPCRPGLPGFPPPTLQEERRKGRGPPGGIRGNGQM